MQYLPSLFLLLLVFLLLLFHFLREISLRNAHCVLAPFTEKYLRLYYWIYYGSPHFSPFLLLLYAN